MPDDERIIRPPGLVTNPGSPLVVAKYRPRPGDLLTGQPRDQTVQFMDYRAVDQLRQVMTSEQMVRQILRKLDVLVKVQTLSAAFRTRSIVVTNTPTPIIPTNRFDRGYILTNPSPSFALTSSVTNFAVGSVFAVATVNSPNFGVANFIKGVAYLEPTVVGVGATLVVDLQARNPLTNTFATAQTDIYGGTPPVVGQTLRSAWMEEGIDITARYAITVGVAGITASLVTILKEGLPGTSTGLSSTVFLGNNDVRTSIGYPLFEGSEQKFFLLSNTAIWGVTSGDPVTINVYDLQ